MIHLGMVDDERAARVHIEAAYVTTPEAVMGKRGGGGRGRTLPGRAACNHVYGIHTPFIDAGAWRRQGWKMTRCEVIRK
jgi:hypothetical protein